MTRSIIRTGSRPRVALVAFMLMAATACSKSQIPTAPSSVATKSQTTGEPAAPPAVQPADSLSITAFSMTGQFADGQFRYWPEVVVKEATGTRSLTITRVTFLLAGTSSPSGDLRMTRELPAGTTWSFGRTNGGVELVSASQVYQATVTVSFVDSTGRTGDATATTNLPSLPPGSPGAALQVLDFTVTRWVEQPGSFGYWPKLTIGQTTGRDALTITRIKFQLLGVGASGNVPTLFRTWQVPAGGTIQLFHELFYGEPAFSISSSREADEVSVVLSFVDSSGRAGDVAATARVSPTEGVSFSVID